MNSTSLSLEKPDLRSSQAHLWVGSVNFFLPPAPICFLIFLLYPCVTCELFLPFQWSLIFHYRIIASLAIEWQLIFSSIIHEICYRFNEIIFVVSYWNINRWWCEFQIGLPSLAFQPRHARERALVGIAPPASDPSRSPWTGSHPPVAQRSHTWLVHRHGLDTRSQIIPAWWCSRGVFYIKSEFHSAFRLAYIGEVWGYGGRSSTTAEEVSRFQCLFPNPNWLVWKSIPPPKTCSNFPWDIQLPYGDLMRFSRNGSVTMTKRGIPKCC